MHVIRAIRADDIDHLEDLAMSATLGITSLPKNRERLEKKLQKALRSFATEVESPQDELYLFLLEKDGEVGGISGIISKTGVEEPSHFLRLETVRQSEGLLPELKILRPIIITDGPTEIGSLFLKKEFRQGGLGKLLSFCRFLFMASFPDRFTEITIAEMRGVITKELDSPFWNAIGRHFYNTTFLEAMERRDKGLFRMSDIIPEYPIYLSLLPQAAQHVAGKTHPNTKPALKMLKELGFTITKDLDYFDAGPKIEAVTAEIKVIQKSRRAYVASIEEEVKGGSFALIARPRLDFRACEGFIRKEKAGIALSREAAEALQVDKGQEVIYYKLRQS